MRDWRYATLLGFLSSCSLLSSTCGFPSMGMLLTFSTVLANYLFAADLSSSGTSSFVAPFHESTSFCFLHSVGQSLTSSCSRLCLLSLWSALLLSYEGLVSVIHPAFDIFTRGSSNIVTLVEVVIRSCSAMYLLMYILLYTSNEVFRNFVSNSHSDVFAQLIAQTSILGPLDLPVFPYRDCGWYSVNYIHSQVELSILDTLQLLINCSLDMPMFIVRIEYKVRDWRSASRVESWRIVRAVVEIQIIFILPGIYFTYKCVISSG